MADISEELAIFRRDQADIAEREAVFAEIDLEQMRRIQTEYPGTPGVAAALIELESVAESTRRKATALHTLAGTTPSHPDIKIALQGELRNRLFMLEAQMLGRLDRVEHADLYETPQEEIRETQNLQIGMQVLRERFAEVLDAPEEGPVQLLPTPVSKTIETKEG